MRVVVLMGGSSMEREVSLATGRGIAAALRAGGHEVAGVDPATGDGLPLEGDASIGSEPPDPVAGGTGLALARSVDLDGVDAVFLALHGGAGENGTLQALLDLTGIPYTGSGMLASALAMDKARAKVMLKAYGVTTPRSRFVEDPSGGFNARSVGGYPLVVKPNAQGSSVGVHLVESESELSAALADAGQYGPVLVEAFIPGREVTVAVLAGKALPVVEVFPEDGFYDYRHKYTRGETRYEVPADLAADAAAELSRLAETAYRALGCAGVARVDFRLDEQGQAFCLEVNTIPGMTATSLVPMAARAAGIEYGELVQRLVDDAVERGDHRSAQRG